MNNLVSLVTQIDSAGQQGQSQVTVPEPSRLALQYYRSGNALWVLDVSVALILPAIILFSGLSSRLRRIATRIGRRWLPTLVLYALLFVVVYAILTAPLAYYEDFVRQHAYGL